MKPGSYFCSAHLDEVGGEGMVSEGMKARLRAEEGRGGGLIDLRTTFFFFFFFFLALAF